MVDKKVEDKKETKKNKKEEPIKITEFIEKSKLPYTKVLNVLIKEKLLITFEREKAGLIKPSLTFPELKNLCKKHKLMEE